MSSEMFDERMSNMALVKERKEEEKNEMIRK